MIKKLLNLFNYFKNILYDIIKLLYFFIKLYYMKIYIIFFLFIFLLIYISRYKKEKMSAEINKNNVNIDIRKLEKNNQIIYPKRIKLKELHFKNIIKKNYKSNREVLENIINPFSGYVISDYFLGTEVFDKDIDINLNNKINLNNITNYEIIKENSIIMCQVNKLKFFVLKILPKLNNKIILITGQWHLDQVRKSDLTDKIINSNKIIRWFSQNPLYEYEKIDKYHGFPYGIKHSSCLAYYNFLISNNKSPKKKNLVQLYCGIHKHLPSNNIRKIYPQICNFPKKKYNDYLLELNQSKFIISTSGDRDDCYRHYEAIGLNTIPISDIGFLYKEIFGDNMLYFDIPSIININKNGKINHIYKETNRDLITTEYWKEWILNHK